MAVPHLLLLFIGCLGAMGDEALVVEMAWRQLSSYYGGCGGWILGARSSHPCLGSLLLIQGLQMSPSQPHKPSLSSKKCQGSNRIEIGRTLDDFRRPDAVVRPSVRSGATVSQVVISCDHFGVLVTIASEEIHILIFLGQLNSYGRASHSNGISSSF